MKKFVKFLIGTSIIAAVKVFNDNYEIKLKKNEKSTIQKDKEKIICKDPDLKNHIDHVYYDNPYNICEIRLDERGCPKAFKFTNKEDKEDVIKNIIFHLIHAVNKGHGYKFTLNELFFHLGLIIDDYEYFKDYEIRFRKQEQFMDYQNTFGSDLVINFGELL